eukprot:TRINITY_DN21121_c0_g1_i1.p1 TRINITY_DN21121_c0_g1~~TRINITY_DN21121_c0_g1_i1.p1  ORF type:complete len:337 (+),score=107.79 TRINITY_DN21121_c0_g1_i1:49-1059(+)
MSAPVAKKSEEETRESVEWLRARGVEVELAGERAGNAAKPLPARVSGRPFAYVCIPADVTVAVTSHEADPAVEDTLPALLAPRFASEEAMDDETVARETASRVKNLLVGGDDSGAKPKPPSAASMQAAAAGGACEAYPLAQATSNNGWKAVRLYIDEVGALRGRPRNQRAEDLAAAAGLVGLSIHGDVYVGRCEKTDAGERNVDFTAEDLAPSAPWAREAAAANSAAAQQGGFGDSEHLAEGSTDAYSWTQTDDDLEVRVLSAPSGKGAAKRVKVSYGTGTSLVVTFDGAEALRVDALFDRIIPDDCSWTLDDGTVVITMEKGDPRPWASLTLPGH